MCCGNSYEDSECCNRIFQFCWYDDCYNASDACVLLFLYGEYSDEVELLRSYRDEVLSKTPMGIAIIQQYYLWSFIIIEAIEEDEEFKEGVKELVDEILPLVEKIVE